MEYTVWNNTFPAPYQSNPKASCRPQESLRKIHTRKQVQLCFKKPFPLDEPSSCDLNAFVTSCVPTYVDIAAWSSLLLEPVAHRSVRVVFSRTVSLERRHAKSQRIKQKNVGRQLPEFVHRWLLCFQFPAFVTFTAGIGSLTRRRNTRPSWRLWSSSSPNLGRTDRFRSPNLDLFTGHAPKNSRTGVV